MKKDTKLTSKNPVAKNVNTVHKPKVFRDKSKDIPRKSKYKGVKKCSGLSTD